MADGDALHIARTKAPSVVGAQKTLQKCRKEAFLWCVLNTFTETAKGWGPFGTQPPAGK
jgi:hypothetical protein